MTGRKHPKPANDLEYLTLIEKLARDVVEEAVREGSFEVFVNEGEKTALQQVLSELARNIRYRHAAGDGCEEGED